MLGKRHFYLIIMFFCIYALGQNPSEWPNLYNYDYSSFSPTTVLKPPLKLKWVTRVFDCFKSGPVVAEGKVICQSRTGYLFCLDAETGELLWQFSNKRYFIPGDYLGSYSYGTRQGPCIAHGRVYTSLFWKGYPEESGLYCFDLATGEILWKRISGATPGRVRISPVVRGNRLYMIGNSEFQKTSTTYNYLPFLQAWDAITGDSLWSHKMLDTAAVVTGICTAGERIIASVAGTDASGKVIGRTAAFDSSGTVIWINTSHYVDHIGVSALGHFQEKLLIGNYESTTLLNDSDGTLIRTDAVGGYQALVVMNNRYWRRGYGGSPAGYNIETGIKELSCKWTNSVTGCGNPSAANGYLYLGHGSPGNHDNPGHVLRAYDAVTGAVAWSFRLNSNGCTAPAIAYDKLYVTSGGDGDLVYCFENAQ